MRWFTIFLVIVVMATGLFAQKKYVIKFATLAPERSTWMKVMRQFDADVRQATNNQVQFKIYPGGIQGDETDVLRKIRLGQLHSAGFTGVGLGEILPEVRILDAPMLFQNYDEVDYISQQLFDEFSQKFRQKKFILLGWTEVGFVYVYSKKPIYNLTDLHHIKMWMWEGDPIAEATFKALGVSAIPLSVTDVRTSLQAGMVDAVYASPLACLSLQWHSRIKYMIDVPLADATGAVLISARMFNKLPPQFQKILLEKGQYYMRRLVALSREDNRKATEAILQGGVQRIQISQEALQPFLEAGKKARWRLVGKLYPSELLERVENMLAEYRASKVNQ